MNTDIPGHFTLPLSPEAVIVTALLLTVTGYLLQATFIGETHSFLIFR